MTAPPGRRRPAPRPPPRAARSAAWRPTPSTTSRSRRSTAPAPPTARCLTSRPGRGPDRHDGRGQRHHGHGSHPQRHGQHRGHTRRRSPSATAPRASRQLHGGTATTVNGSTPTGDGHQPTPPRRDPERPGAQHRVLLPGRGDQQRRHHLRLGAQLHHLTEAPAATTSAATGVTATGATLNGTVNAENASTTVTFCYSTSSPGELLGRHHR